jgi:hypothetical protein
LLNALCGEAAQVFKLFKVFLSCTHCAASPNMLLQTHGAVKPHLLIRQIQPFHLHVRRFAPHCEAPKALELRSNFQVFLQAP